MFQRMSTICITNVSRTLRMANKSSAWRPIVQHDEIKCILCQDLLHNQALPPAPPMPTANFWNTLDSFPNQSLWNYFQCDNDNSWIPRGLMGGTMLMRHEGSYMVDIDLTIRSAAFIIQCTATGNEVIGSIV